MTDHTYLPPMNIHHKPFIDLARFIGKYRKNLTDDTTPKAAAKALNKWESFQGIDYLADLDLDTPEKRIQAYLEMLVYAPTYERQCIYKLLYSNLQDYADICQHCPSGMFSKTLLDDVMVTVDNSK